MRFIHFILVYNSILLCRGDSISNDFYLTFDVAIGEAGYRLLNGTHQFGFDGTVDGSRGVIVMVEDGDMSGLRECWRSRFKGYTGKYHMVMPVEMIDRSTVRDILQSNCLAGIIAYNLSHINETKPLSHDAACPNSVSGFSKVGCAYNVWNEEGAILPEGLRNIDWNIQLLYIYNQTYIDAIRTCYEIFNHPVSEWSAVTFPFCGASFGTFNRAAGSTEICVRRSRLWTEYISYFTGSPFALCSPLMGINVITHIPPKVRKNTKSGANNGEPSRSDTRYLMLTARLDSFGLIPEISPGEISVITSVIALLAVVQAISKNMHRFEQAALASNKHLLIAFFDGEAFDYIGSSNMAFDMMNGAFPREPRSDLTESLESILASQLDGIIEVQQLGTGDGQKLYAQSDGRQAKNGQIVGILTSLWAGVTAADGILVPPTEYSEMPPSSLHSFAKVNSSISGVVLTPFQVKYEYLRYNSMLDIAQWDSAQRSTAISEVIIAANAMLRAAADHVVLDDDTKSKLKVDKEFVSKLFECFFDPSHWHSCEYITKIAGKRTKDPYYYTGKSTFVGTSADDRLRHTVWVLAMHLTGTTAHNHSNVKDQHECRKLGEGQNVYTYNVLIDPETNISHCYRTPVHFYVVTSPAFLIDDYKFSNSTYSTWTKAMYSSANLQLFLIEYESLEDEMLYVGMAFLVLSFLVAYRFEDEFIMISESTEETPKSESSE